MRALMTTAEMRRLVDSPDVWDNIVGALHLAVSLQHELPWLAARRLVGVNIIQGDDECLLVLKADGRHGPQVSFHDGDDIADALVNMAKALLWDAAIWRTDKYRTTRSDK